MRFASLLRIVWKYILYILLQHRINNYLPQKVILRINPLHAWMIDLSICTNVTVRLEYNISILLNKILYSDVSKLWHQYPLFYLTCLIGIQSIWLHVRQKINWYGLLSVEIHYNYKKTQCGVQDLLSNVKKISPI